MATPPPLQGWVPVSARMRDGTLVADLCRIGARRFTEPFFDDTIAACMRLPFNAVFRQRLDIDVLAQWLQRHPGLPPGGFVFHMSRCGSTLASQWLAASPAHRVISEAPSIDAALRAGDGAQAVDEDRRVAWVRAMVGMLAQPGSDGERRLFVKFDSWHSSLLPLILRAFPGVPWVFMVRDPVEVIVSHLRRPGAQMVPGMMGYAPPGVDPHDAVRLPREEYCARVLGAICEGAERAFDAGAPLGRVIDYEDLPAALDDVVSPHFALAPDFAASQDKAAVLRRDAKQPHFEFTRDGAAKRSEASDAVLQAAQRWVLPAVERLRARRGRPS